MVFNSFSVDPTFESLSLEHLVRQHLESVRCNTQKGYLSLLNHLASFHPHPIPLREVSPLFCEKFAAYLLSRMKPNSVCTYLQKLRTIMQQAVRHGVVAQNPISSVGALIPRYTAPERCYLLPNEIQQLEATPCEHSITQKAFLFACHTGLRLSDIETLRWVDIHEMEGHYMVVKLQVKTQHEVRIPLDRFAVKLLQELQQEGGFVEKERVFNLYSRTLIAHDLQRWGAAAGLKKHLTFHVSRHTFATLMASSQCDIFVVSELCGHTSVKTTQIYARLIDPARFRAMDCLDKMFPCGGGPVKLRL